MSTLLPGEVHRFALEELAPEPWKNGRGMTRTLAMKTVSGEPLWRISVADIDQDGPFSLFPGVDRVSMLVAGAGLQLKGNGQTFHFSCIGHLALYPGEVHLDARLEEVPARLLNVMTLRHRATAEVRVERSTCTLPTEGFVIVLVLVGAVTVRCLDGLLLGRRAAEGFQLPRSVHPVVVESDSRDACWAVITLREVEQE